jgi:hypothetical protein
VVLVLNIFQQDWHAKPFSIVSLYPGLLWLGLQQGINPPWGHTLWCVALPKLLKFINILLHAKLWSLFSYFLYYFFFLNPLYKHYLKNILPLSLFSLLIKLRKHAYYNIPENIVVRHVSFVKTFGN